MKSALALTFHGISKEEKSVKKNRNPTVDRYWISDKKFCEILDLIHPEKCCTASGFLEKLEGDWRILTFDDGSISDFDIAFPLLAEKKIRSTFFITAENIEQNGYCTAKHLQEMAKEGMEIASHGLTHDYLVTMSKAKAANEIRESKERLQDKLGVEIQSYAPVGGHFQKWMSDEAGRAGYKVFATMIPGKTTIANNLVMLQRNHIQKNHNLKYITSLLNGRQRILLANRLKYSVLRLPKIVLGMKNYDRVKDWLL